MSAIRSLVSEIVDYAGLFPPAGLPMDTVVQNYAKYWSGPHRWMLSRLIVPTARFSEFESSSDSWMPTGPGEQPWPISALVPPVTATDEGFANALRDIAAFNQRHVDPQSGLSVVDAIEIRSASVDEIQQIATQLPDSITAFVEINHRDDPTEMIAELAKVQASHGDRFNAKIRTGGVTPDLIPPAAHVARFLACCGEHLVPLKATAGLHHPVRAEYRLTYESDAPVGTMHGFVNVFVAACFAFAGVDDVESLTTLLEVTDIDEFSFDDQGLTWRDWRLSAARIAATRRRFVTSFGSCSFDEPTNELQQLGFQASFVNA